MISSILLTEATPYVYCIYRCTCIYDVCGGVFFVMMFVVVHFACIRTCMRNVCVCIRYVTYTHTHGSCRMIKRWRPIAVAHTLTIKHWYVFIRQRGSLSCGSCSVLQCVAVCCSHTLTIKHWYVFIRQRGSLSCGSCSVLQCVAVCCSHTLTIRHWYVFIRQRGSLLCGSCSVLQCDAVCCSVLQCDAV